jgi:hypothetical protein
VLSRLGHPPAVGGHDKQHGWDRADASKHVRHEPGMPGHVDERQLFS